MEVLEIGFQPLQDFDRIRHGWLGDVNLLEATGQGPILLEMLTVFLIGG